MNEEILNAPSIPSAANALPQDIDNVLQKMMASVLSETERLRWST